MDKIRAALVGCGRVGTVHGEILASLEEVELVACCDVKLERAQEFCRKYGGTPVADYRELLKRSDIDVLELATPHHQHANIAIDAAKAGKHVLTEKPMAINVSDVEEMIRTAREHGVTLGVVLQNRYNDTSQAAKKAVESGQIGEIKAARAIVTWNRDDAYYARSDWKGFWATEGGGALINQAIHTIDLLQWLVGEPVIEVAAHCATWAHKAIEVEDTAMAMLTFKNGVLGSIYANTVYAYDPPNFLEIYGSKGLIQIEGTKATIRTGNQVMVVEEGGTDAAGIDYIKSTGVGYWGFSHMRQIREFYQDLLAGRSHSIDGEVGKIPTLLVLAMYEASRRGTPISFPDGLK